MFVVLGATGHTGSVVAKNLLAAKQKVRVVGRSADQLKPLVAAGAEPYTADVTSVSAVTNAFKGADAAYVLIPPNPTSTDFAGHQDQVSDAIAAAVQNAGVKKIVLLSSIGADKPSGTGPVVGLHKFEQKLNRLDGADVLHLRAGYFMENTLPQAGVIRAMGMVAGPIHPDLKLPMIASRDIGAAAADALLRGEFRGKQTKELHGQRDITYSEVASIIGNAIGKTSLNYVQPPDEQLRGALMQMGMSANLANLILEMAGALNSGYMKALEPRSDGNTTPTSYEMFVDEEFVPAYRQQQAAA